MTIKFGRIIDLLSDYDIFINTLFDKENCVYRGFVCSYNSQSQTVLSSKYSLLISRLIEIAFDWMEHKFAQNVNYNERSITAIVLKKRVEKL